MPLGTCHLVSWKPCVRNPPLVIATIGTPYLSRRGHRVDWIVWLEFVRFSRDTGCWNRHLLRHVKRKKGNCGMIADRHRTSYRMGIRMTWWELFVLCKKKALGMRQFWSPVRVSPRDLLNQLSQKYFENQITQEKPPPNYSDITARRRIGLHQTHTIHHNGLGRSSLLSGPVLDFFSPNPTYASRLAGSPTVTDHVRSP